MLESTAFFLGSLYGRIPKRIRPHFLALFIIVIGSCTYYGNQVGSRPERIEPTKNIVARVLTPEQKERMQAAQNTMNTLMLDNEIYEEGFHLVVNMKIILDDPDARLRYIKTIAGVDVILNGQLRNIYFYSPTGKQIGQADKVNGVRLL